MADNKKYYYLKLKDDFYDRDEMVILEGLPDGILYSNLLLKLYLKSIKTNGRLMFSERIPYNADMLAQLTRHPVAVVEKGISVFKEMGLIEILDNGAIYVLDVQNFIGRSSTEGDRKRQQRLQIAQEQALLGGRTNVRQMSDKRPPEKEIEIEIEIELEKEQQQSKLDKDQEWGHAVVGDAVSQGADLTALASLEGAVPPVENAVSPVESAVSREAVFAAAKQAFGELSISGFVVEEIGYILQEVSAELLIEALRETKLNGGRTIKYTKAIIKTWQGEGLLTVEQVRAAKTKPSAGQSLAEPSGKWGV